MFAVSVRYLHHQIQDRAAAGGPLPVRAVLFLLSSCLQKGFRRAEAGEALPGERAADVHDHTGRRIHSGAVHQDPGAGGLSRLQDHRLVMVRRHERIRF